MRLRRELELEAAGAGKNTPPPASASIAQGLPSVESSPPGVSGSVPIEPKISAPSSPAPQDPSSPSDTVQAQFPTPPSTVADALRREAVVLEEAVADGAPPERATALSIITAALEGAALPTAEALECAELLADAILVERGPVRDVWQALVGSAKAGRRGEIPRGQARYLAARLAKTSGLDEERARRHVAVLAAAAGVRLGPSVPVEREPAGLRPGATATTPPLEVVGGFSSRAGDKLREVLRTAVPGAEIRLPGGEFEGPFELTRAVALRGQGEATTLWMRKGPVVTVRADGVTLDGLLVEATDPDGIALLTATGQPPHLSRVTIKGRRESAAPATLPTSAASVPRQASVPAAWLVPSSLDFGTVVAGTSVERFVDVETPGPARVVCTLSGVHAEPSTLPGGRAQLRIRLEGSQIVAGSLLAGDLEIVSGTERRAISLFAAVQASAPVSTSPPSASSTPSTGAQSQTPSATSPVRAASPSVGRRRLAAGVVAGLGIVAALGFYLYQDAGRFAYVRDRQHAPTPSRPATGSPTSPAPRAPSLTRPRGVPEERSGGRVQVPPSGRVETQEGGRVDAGRYRGLRSVEGRVATDVIFANRLREPVGVYWIDYQGSEVFYRTLQPGESYRQQTYVTHPWVVRHSGTGLILKTIVASLTERAVTIDAESSKTEAALGRESDAAARREEEPRRQEAEAARTAAARADAARAEEARVREAEAARRVEEQRRRDAEAARQAEEQRRREAEAARVAAARAEEAQRLRESIVAGLTQKLHDRGLRELTITVDEQRRVLLGGRVDEPGDRETALQIARDYPGVAAVETRIRVRREEMRKAIERGKFE